MNKVVTIGTPPWSRRDLLKKLEEFASLYEDRPIKDNKSGMKSPHMFLAWFAMQSLRPKAIIESGVWRGQGTWFFEKACPEAKLYCIDIDLTQLQYKSENAEYYKKDFSAIDWGYLPKADTVLFFDDHQNAFERVKLAHRLGFKHLLFEDNYPAAQGDCYSLKKCFMHSGFEATPPPRPKTFKARLKHQVKKIFGEADNNVNKNIPPNSMDAEFLIENSEIYYEFPPIFKTELTRWDDPWEDEKYPTPEPLLKSIEKPFQQIYLDEAKFYTWMCYLKLK